MTSWQEEWTEDSEAVASLKARLCAVCQALVTPPHRLCGWHDFWYNMRLPYRTDPNAVLIRRMLGYGPLREGDQI